jgi:hypothetical protein
VLKGSSTLSVQIQQVEYKSLLILQLWLKLTLKLLALPPWTMSAPGLTAVSSLPMVRLGEDEIRPIHVVIYALNQRLVLVRWRDHAHR